MPKTLFTITFARNVVLFRFIKIEYLSCCFRILSLPRRTLPRLEIKYPGSLGMGLNSSVMVRVWCSYAEILSSLMVLDLKVPIVVLIHHCKPLVNSYSIFASPTGVCTISPFWYLQRSSLPWFSNICAGVM